LASGGNFLFVTLITLINRRLQCTHCTRCSGHLHTTLQPNFDDSISNTRQSMFLINFADLLCALSETVGWRSD
jgi:hypothetical protein